MATNVPESWLEPLMACNPSVDDLMELTDLIGKAIGVTEESISKVISFGNVDGVTMASAMEEIDQLQESSPIFAREHKNPAAVHSLRLVAEGLSIATAILGRMATEFEEGWAEAHQEPADA